MATVPFWAPLKSSLVLARGQGFPTSTRATTATVFDQDGVMRTTLAGEARFTGARRVQNYIASSENIAGSGSSVNNGTGAIALASNNYGIAPDGSNTAARIVANLGAGTTVNDYSFWRFALSMALPSAPYVSTAWIKSNTGINQVVSFAANSPTSIVIVTPQWQPMTITQSGSGAFDIGTRGTFATSTVVDVLIWHPMFESVGSQSNQNPAEYVSNGVLSAPYHGAGVDGVQYFEYLNGNTVSGNVVTAGFGAPISDATLKGYLSEPLTTNFLLNSGVPATQTTGSLGLGTYCLWLTGAGSVALTAGTAIITGAGTATAAAPLVFTVTTAGTVTATVTAPVTTFQLENNPYPTSYTATAAATVTRNADIDSYQSSGNILVASGTIYLEFTPNHAPSGTIYLLGTYVDANNSTAIMHDGANLIFRKRITGVNYDATYALAFVSGTRYKVCASWGSAGTTIYVNGAAGTPNANATAAQIGTTLQVGADGNSLSQPTAQIKSVRAWQSQLPNATQSVIST